MSDEPTKNSGMRPPSVALKLVGEFVKAKNSHSIKDLQRKCNFSRQGVVSRIINGRQRITADIANKLTEFLGGSADFWVSLEAKVLDIEPKFMVDYVKSSRPDVRMLEVLSMIEDEFAAAGRNSSHEPSQERGHTFTKNGETFTLDPSAGNDLVKELFQMWLDHASTVKVEPQEPLKLLK